MKIFVVLSLCIAVASAGCENLAKREACNRPEGDCSCQAGLSCVLTKKIFLDGNTIPVKQCMPQGMEIEVETVDFDNEEQTSPAFRAKRFLGILTRCSSENDCAPNFCCPILLHRCLPKILENGACNFNTLHKCGCMDGLVCQKTTDVAIFPGISIPLEQCIKM